MIDEAEKTGLKNELSELSTNKIEQSKISRQVVKKSKQLIYAIHRGDMESAGKHALEIKSERKHLDEIAQTEKLRKHGSYGVAVQEYVEAVAYYELMTNKRLPGRKQLGADAEHYLMGLSDLTGELVRKAVDDMVNDRYEHAIWLKDVVAEIYGLMIGLDFDGGEARRKSDQVKWNLSKLEDKVYDAKIRDKL